MTLVIAGVQAGRVRSALERWGQRGGLTAAHLFTVAAERTSAIGVLWKGSR